MNKKETTKMSNGRTVYVKCKSCSAEITMPIDEETKVCPICGGKLE